MGTPDQRRKSSCFLSDLGPANRGTLASEFKPVIFRPTTSFPAPSVAFQGSGSSLPQHPDASPSLCVTSSAHSELHRPHLCCFDQPHRGAVLGGHSLRLSPAVVPGFSRHPRLPFSHSGCFSLQASWLASSASHPHTLSPSHSPLYPSYFAIHIPADPRDTRPTAPEPRVSPCRVRWPVAKPVCTQMSTR